MSTQQHTLQTQARLGRVGEEHSPEQPQHSTTVRAVTRRTPTTTVRMAMAVCLLCLVGSACYATPEHDPKDFPPTTSDTAIHTVPTLRSSTRRRRPITSWDTASPPKVFPDVETLVPDPKLHNGPLETHTPRLKRERRQGRKKRRRNKHIERRNKHIERRNKQTERLSSVLNSSSPNFQRHDSDMEANITKTAVPPHFIIRSMLLYPPPWLPFRTVPRVPSPTTMPGPPQQTNRTNNMTMSAGSASESEKTVDRVTVVKVYADDWDDMETCPYWCKKDNGQIHCCPRNNVREGECPKREDLCVLKSSMKRQDPHYCVSDDVCPEKNKCCFDRCVDARVCKPAVFSGTKER